MPVAVIVDNELAVPSEGKIISVELYLSSSQIDKSKAQEQTYVIATKFHPPPVAEVDFCTETVCTLEPVVCLV